MFERRRLTLFLTCLSVAVLAWLFFALSNKYFYKVSTQIHYTNLPQEKAFHPLQSDLVSLEVEGTGWELLFKSMRIAPRSIDVDINRLNTTNNVILTDQLKAINRQLGSTHKILSIAPDTLYFDFTSRSVKKIPVKFDYDLSYNTRYNISGPVRLVPEYVTVSGPAEEIADIKSWPTYSLKRTEVGGDVVTKVMLMPSKQPNITIYPDAVNVLIPVGEFTENSIDVPVNILNNKGYDVKLLPEKVKVTFLTALSNFPQITNKSIKAAIDMGNWERGYAQLPVRLVKFPPYCKLIRIEPQIVDYYIQ